MSAMKREKQYDMFDVATGACTLDDYLFQRYSENDLSSNFWIDEKDEVDELRAPKPTADGQPGTEPEVIPIQGPRAARPAQAGPPKPPQGLEAEGPSKIPEPTVYTPAPATPSPAAIDGQDTLLPTQRSAPEVPSQESFQSGRPVAPSPETFQSQSSEREQTIDTVETTGTPGPDTPQPPSMEDLLARFHQATQEYQQRAQQGEESEESDS